MSDPEVSLALSGAAEPQGGLNHIQSKAGWTQIIKPLGQILKTACHCVHPMLKAGILWVPTSVSLAHSVAVVHNM